jgi:hypothetical protein
VWDTRYIQHLLKFYTHPHCTPLHFEGGVWFENLGVCIGRGSEPTTYFPQRPPSGHWNGLIRSSLWAEKETFLTIITGKKGRKMEKLVATYRSWKKEGKGFGPLLPPPRNWW